MAKFEADPLSVPASGPMWPVDGAPTWAEFLTAMKVGGLVGFGVDVFLTCGGGATCVGH